MIVAESALPLASTPTYENETVPVAPTAGAAYVHAIPLGNVPHDAAENVTFAGSGSASVTPWIGTPVVFANVSVYCSRSPGTAVSLVPAAVPDVRFCTVFVIPFVCATDVVNEPLTGDPVFGVSVATFVYDDAVPAAAVSENVRPEFAGNVASVAVTVFPETDTVGQTAPPVVTVQLGVPVIVNPAGSGSLRMAPFDALGPPL